MKIDSHTSLLGLIGNPIKHSLSPVMHNAVFNHLDVNGVYLCFQIEEDNLKAVLDGFKSIGVKGVNITIPYKEKIIPLLDDLDSLAKQIEAVNTVCFKGDKMIGYNTDSAGFLKALAYHGCDIKGRKALLIGAGGAGRAIAFALINNSIETLYIYDIDSNRASSLTSDIKSKIGQADVKALKDISKDIIRGVQLLVNATPVGMVADDDLLFPLDYLHKELTVYDIVYNNKTVLVEKAKDMDLKAYNGLSMLLFQALASEKIWFEDNIIEEDALNIMIQTLSQEGFAL